MVKYTGLVLPHTQLPYILEKNVSHSSHIFFNDFQFDEARKIELLPNINMNRVLYLATTVSIFIALRHKNSFHSVRTPKPRSEYFAVWTSQLVNKSMV